MKAIITFLLTAVLISVSVAQPCRNIYKQKLDGNSKLLSCGLNYTIEKTKDKLFVLKRYYTGNKMVTHRFSYKTRKFVERHGLCEERWDDGTVVNSGVYAHNLKQGRWLENVNQAGFYVDDLRHGVWKTYNGDSLLIKETNYLAGVIHGKELQYDSLGNISKEFNYDRGQLIISDQDSLEELIEVQPRFPGCEEKGLSEEELDKCATKLFLERIYSSIKYPPVARNNGIQGTALVTYVITETGAIKYIEVRNGISPEIKDEIIRVVEDLPNFIPGRQNGEAVRVQYNLPIRFQLEN